MNTFKGKVALVTGSSSGIGAAVAIALAEQGADVIVHYNTGEERAQKIVGQIRKAGCRSEAFQANTRKPESIRQFVEDAIAVFEKIDILVNCAGKFDDFAKYDNMTEELWDAVMETNINGTFWFNKYVTDHMVKEGKGVVVTVASAAGVMSNGGGPAYTTSKWAMVGMMKNLTAELGRKGIRANTILPGLVDTPMVADLKASPEFMSSINGTPAGRIATTKDLANLITFLVSDDAEYIHGADILIDGGLVAGGGHNFKE
ncbi:MAG: SDR family oxidoreductase [Eubacteriaceae bacterium]|nr:SDR family oxidoreductase [Eubacteriaceae bacterium]